MHSNIILHLTLIEDIGPAALYEIIEKIGIQKLSNIYDFSQKDFESLDIASKYAALLVHGLSDRSVLEKEIALMVEHKVSFITFFDEQYPKLLKQIHVPPLVLYVQGDVSLFSQQKTIACVGARKAHRYAHDVLNHILPVMIVQGWIVVSGGALGADTYAHQITLEQKGKTIVVVGSGLCFQYPASNKKLFEQVVYYGGLIVSIFPMQTPPDAQCFPQRNRIISGLSQGCVVLQAAQKSGALITAQCALDQGREVFAVPGPIFDPLSAGCHDLIAQGAKLVSNASDVLDELQYSDQAVQQKIFKPTKMNVKISFDPVQESIIQACTVPITADHLMTKLGLEMQQLQNLLFSLSLDGKIEQDAMGFWKRL